MKIEPIAVGGPIDDIRLAAIRERLNRYAAYRKDAQNTPAAGSAYDSAGRVGGWLRSQAKTALDQIQESAVADLAWLLDRLEEVDGLRLTLLATRAERDELARRVVLLGEPVRTAP